MTGGERWAEGHFAAQRRPAECLPDAPGKSSSKTVLQSGPRLARCPRRQLTIRLRSDIVAMHRCRMSSRQRVACSSSPARMLVILATARAIRAAVRWVSAFSIECLLSHDGWAIAPGQDPVENAKDNGVFLCFWSRSLSASCSSSMTSAQEGRRGRLRADRSSKTLEKKTDWFMRFLNRRRAADLPLPGRRVDLQGVVRRYCCDAAI